MDKSFQSGLSGVAWGTTKGSSFDVDEWALYDWSMMLSKHPTIERLAEIAEKSGIDAREAFFALSGYPICTGDATGQAWQALLAAPAWQKARERAIGPLERAAILESLLGLAADRRIEEQTASESQNHTNDQGSDGTQDGEMDLNILAGMMAPSTPNVPEEDEVEEALALSEMALLLAGKLSGSEGTDRKSALDDAFLLATKLKLGNFTDLLGFVKRVVKGASRRSKQTQGELVGHGRETWSERVIATDMLAVAQGSTEALIRAAEGQLAVRKCESDAKLGKGPVILLRDETLSMVLGQRGQEMKHHAAALSLEIAMADIFNSEGRELCTIAWGAGYTRKHTWGEEGLHQHLSSNIRGCWTKLFNALNIALDVATEYVDGADILILTDGELNDSEALRTNLNLKKKLEEFWDAKGRVWAIVLGDLDKNDWERNLPICDGIVSMDGIQNGEGLEEILSGMANRSTGDKRRI